MRKIALRHLFVDDRELLDQQLKDFLYVYLYVIVEFVKIVDRGLPVAAGARDVQGPVGQEAFVLLGPDGFLGFLEFFEVKPWGFFAAEFVHFFYDQKGLEIGQKVLDNVPLENTGYGVHPILA
jgi:hypothetical protein